MKLFCCCALLLLAACAAGQKTVLVGEKISGPKVIALDAPRTPWVVEIENRLRQRGFKVLRWASQKRVREKIDEQRTEEFREAAVRYVLVLDGDAPLDPMHRCFAGGWRFEYLTAELVDVSTNETLLSVSGSGYSENCPPLSGSLFSDIVSSVEGSWQ